MVTCSRCGQENPEGFAFCGACAAPLAPTEPARDVRKVVTVVFSDVTGSTALGEQLDPESLRRVMGRYFDEMQSVVESHEGTVEKFIGDAVMAVFGIPVLHEDDALRAVRAASEMRERLAALNEELERDWGVTIAVRTGVNTGEVVAGDGSEGQRFATGDAVNVAKRFEEAAPPGEVLLGETTYRLVRDAVEVEPTEPLGSEGQERSGQGVPAGHAGGRPARPGPPPRFPDGRTRTRARRARAGLPASRRGTRVPPVHGSRRRGRRQVEADRGVPGGCRRRGDGDARPLPSLRRGDHVLAARRGPPRSLRRGTARRDRRRSVRRRGTVDHGADRRRDRPRRERRSAGRNGLGGPPALRGRRPGPPARRPLRRPAVGRAHVPRPRRASGRLGSRSADPAHLPRAPRVPRRAAELGRREVQRHLGAPRTAERR